eukprot:XP_019925801.1 PREDICTED: uncharacterized protein LOC105335404 [Crassostrea gigas]
MAEVKPEVPVRSRALKPTTRKETEEKQEGLPLETEDPNDYRGYLFNFPQFSGFHGRGAVPFKIRSSILIGCPKIKPVKKEDQQFCEIPTRKQTVSRNIKIMNQSDIVLTPVSKGPKNITWRKVLAMVLLLAFVIALVVTLILLLLKDESHNNTPKGNTTQIQTTPNTFLELNHTICKNEC